MQDLKASSFEGGGRGVIRASVAISRAKRAINRRNQRAHFRGQRTLEDFEFQFNPKINGKQVHQLAAGHYLKEALFIGPPGVGKSHLAQALCNAAINQGHNVL